MTDFDPIQSQLCPIWLTLAKVSGVQNYDQIEVNSPRAGGVYRITRSAQITIQRDLHPGLNAKITTWLVEQRLNGISDPIITSDVVKSVRQRDFLPYSKKLDNFFKYLDQLETYVGESIVIRGGTEQKSSDTLAAYIEARQGPEIRPEQVDEVAKFINVIASAGYITARQPTNDLFGIKIEPKGWEYIEEISRRKSNSDEAFVAMWFDPSLNDVFNTQIEAALNKCGYKSPFRIDHVEHSDKIDDAIIAKMNKSIFVIVDLTCEIFNHPSPTENKTKIVEARGGVYFEAGYAMGLGIPVIWTCRRDCVSHIHFDLRQYNQIVWYPKDGNYLVDGQNGQISFKEALVNRISALRLNRRER